MRRSPEIVCTFVNLQAPASSIAPSFRCSIRQVPQKEEVTRLGIFQAVNERCRKSTSSSFQKSISKDLFDPYLVLQNVEERLMRQ